MALQESAAAPATAEEPGRTSFDGADRRPAALFGTAVLTLAYLLAYCDRTIVTILVGPIKSDLGFSDSKIALLIGFCFAIFYSIAGLWLGRLTDTVSRRNLLLTGVLCWSAATAACGLLNDFPGLFVARVCVGIGEACVVPASLSMIADYFGPRLRAKAVATFVCGAPLGSGLAYLLGGTLLNHLQHDGPPRWLPVLTHFPWQLVFLTLGTGGLLVAGLLTLVTEPPRTHSDINELPEDRHSLRKLLASDRRLLVCLILGPSIMSIAFYALLAWGPTLDVRRFGWGPQDIAHWFTPLSTVSGVLGPWIGAWAGMRLVKAGRSDGMMRAAVWLAVIAGVAAIPATLVPFVGVSIALMFVASGLMIGVITLPQVAIQYIMPGYVRGQVTALFAFSANIIGFGLGPNLVALVTDYVFRRDSSLNLSLAFVCGSAIVLGAVVTAWLLPDYRAFVRAHVRRDSATDS